MIEKILKLSAQCKVHFVYTSNILKRNLKKSMNFSCLLFE
jgi:hypothetical protein